MLPYRVNTFRQRGEVPEANDVPSAVVADEDVEIGPVMCRTADLTEVRPRLVFFFFVGGFVAVGVVAALAVLLPH